MEKNFMKSVRDDILMRVGSTKITLFRLFIPSSF